MKGPWAPCAAHVVDDLFAREGAHAVSPAEFATAFCAMALRPQPPSFWTNSVRDGCVRGCAARVGRGSSWGWQSA